MKKIKLLFSIIMLVLLLVGCKNTTSKVEKGTDNVVEQVEDRTDIINVPYVESRLGDDVEISEIDDIIKENKGRFVRWTANVKEIEKKKIVIQLEGLTRVEAMFNDNVNEDKHIKEGDIITVSGNLKTYYKSLFEIPPIWIVENCRIEETTEEERKFVIDFNKKLEEEANKIISADYKNFYENYMSMTEVQKNDYFNNIYGHWVQWTGVVGEVTRDYIGIKCLDYTFEFDYIAYFSPEDIEKLKSINKGEEVTIKGKIYTVVNGEQWQINNCTIIK